MLWTLNFSKVVSGHQFFLVMLNLRSNFFRNFFYYRALWTLNFSEGVSGHQLFLVTLNFSELFHLHSTLDSEFFRGDVQSLSYFLVMLDLRSNFFQNFFIYRVLWTLNNSGKGDLGTNSFW